MPRIIWNQNKTLQRKNVSDIDTDDAVVYFRKVNSNNPDVAGSEAFHIAVVTKADPVNFTDTIDLSIAESSGAKRPDGGNGVNARDIGKITLGTDAVGRCYYEPSAEERWYFIGPLPGAGPYQPETLAAA